VLVAAGVLGDDARFNDVKPLLSFMPATRARHASAAA